MFTRALVSLLVERLNESRKFIQIVIGPRQTGKTTAVLQALDRIKYPHHYISADDPNVLSAQWLSNEWEQARALAGTEEAVLVIDEIQNLY